LVCEASVLEQEDSFSVRNEMGVVGAHEHGHAGGQPAQELDQAARSVAVHRAERIVQKQQMRTRRLETERVRERNEKGEQEKRKGMKSTPR
jgi:dUTPase